MKRSVYIAIIIALVAAGWLGSGIFRSEISEAIGSDLAAATPDDAATAPVSEAAAATKTSQTTAHEKHALAVQSQTYRAEDRSVDIILRGRTDSVRTVQLMAETSGTIVKLMKGKGDRVKPGDRIAQLSLQDREARRLEAVALVKQREIERNAAVKLTQKGYKSETAAAAAEAQLDAAKAALKRIEVEISQLVIRAPFEGTISARQVQLGAFVGVGDPVVTIVDQDPILIVGNISEREVGIIAVGSQASATLIGGREVSGKVRFISPTADAATRTFRVEIEAPNPDGAIRDGITAEIRLATGSAPAHRLSPAVLTLDDRGVLGVRTIGPGEIVRFMPVSILAEGSDGVWVSGLPETVEVITVGQEYVKDGERVRVVVAPSN